VLSQVLFIYRKNLIRQSYACEGESRCSNGEIHRESREEKTKLPATQEKESL